MKSYNIVELLPVNQYAALGYAPPTEQTPSVFGSVADGDDSTFTTLESEMTPADVQYSEVLSVDFELPDAVMPNFMHMRMRVRDNAEYLANTDRVWALNTLYSAVAESPGNPFDQYANYASDGQLGPLHGGAFPDPTWIDFAFASGYTTVDPVAPNLDNWFEVNIDSANWRLANAFATGGVRFTIYPYAYRNTDPRTAYLDIFEVRMVVAYEQAASPYVPPTLATPSLRMLQRGGSGGMSGVPRMIGNPTIRGSVRRGPGSIL